MGLDMYLYKRTFYGGEYRGGGHKGPHTLELSGEYPKDQRIKRDRISYIIEQVGYWRKANAIHKWFVDNVQDGVDECQESYVSEEDIRNLLATVTKVLDARSKPVEELDEPIDLLPTQSGFFFGDTDYNEWYWGDLEDTKSILESIIKELEEVGRPRDFSYYYQSSW